MKRLVTSGRSTQIHVMRPLRIALLSVFIISGIASAQKPVFVFPFDGNAEPTGSIQHKMIGKLSFETGVIGSAGTFKGSTSIEVNDAKAFQSPQFSISAWACPEQEKCSGRIVEKGASNSFWLTFYWGRVRFGFWSRDEGYNEIDSESKFKANEWRHVVGTFDGTELRVYVDGKLETTRVTSDRPTFNREPLVVGAKRDGIAADAFIGALDEVAFFDRALTQAEVTELYSAGR